MHESKPTTGLFPFPPHVAGLYQTPGSRKSPQKRDADALAPQCSKPPAQTHFLSPFLFQNCTTNQYTNTWKCFLFPLGTSNYNSDRRQLNRQVRGQPKHQAHSFGKLSFFQLSEYDRVQMEYIMKERRSAFFWGNSFGLFVYEWACPNPCCPTIETRSTLSKLLCQQHGVTVKELDSGGVEQAGCYGTLRQIPSQVTH